MMNPLVKVRADECRGSVLFILLLFPGCMSATRIEHPPEELQRALRSGEIVQVGDRVRVETTSRGNLVFEVAEISEDSIRGEDEVVPIEQIVALETLEFGKAAHGATTVVGYLVIATLLVGVVSLWLFYGIF